MKRKIHDPSVVHSSIAMLQERFRQLQRVKEMREKRDQLLKMKMLGTEQPKQYSNSNYLTRTDHEATRVLYFFHPELMNPSRSRSPSPLPPHVSLSLWPTSQDMQEDNNSSSSSDTVEMITPVVSNNLCSTDCFTHTTQTLQASWNVNVSDSDVDTSLHL